MQEKTLLLLRNLVYNTTSEIQAALRWSSGQLLSKILRVAEQPDEDPRLLQHALYAVVNVTSSHASNKKAVMDAGWPTVLVSVLGHSDAGIREAAAWVVINLAWKGGDIEDAADREACRQRLSALRVLGIEQKLEILKDDPCVTVRERAVNALSYFGHGGGDEVVDPPEGPPLPPGAFEDELDLDDEGGIDLDMGDNESDEEEDREFNDWDDYRS